MNLKDYLPIFYIFFDSLFFLYIFDRHLIKEKVKPNIFTAIIGFLLHFPYSILLFMAVRGIGILDPRQDPHGGLWMIANFYCFPVIFLMYCLYVLLCYKKFVIQEGDSSTSEDVSSRSDLNQRI